MSGGGNESANIIAGQGASESYVVAGAIISCNWGTKRMRLKTPLSHGVYIQKQAQLNIGDYMLGTNIMPFERCMSQSNPAVVAAGGIAPCTPIIALPWTNGKTETKVGGLPALLSCSKNSCLYCGTISIEDDGQGV